MKTNYQNSYNQALKANVRKLQDFLGYLIHVKGELQGLAQAEFELCKYFRVRLHKHNLISVVIDLPE